MDCPKYGGKYPVDQQVFIDTALCITAKCAAEKEPSSKLSCNAASSRTGSKNVTKKMGLPWGFFSDDVGNSSQLKEVNKKGLLSAI